LKLNGKSILQWSIEAFDSLPSIHEIVVVAPADHIKEIQCLLTPIAPRKVSCIVPGGKERQDSVWNGLNAFSDPPDIVLVHDAVRPLVSAATIDEVIRETRLHRAAVVGVRVKDTVKVEGKRGYYAATLDRSKLWAVQTPQGFEFDLLMKAHRKAQRERFLGTDEASLVERMRIPVRIVEGDYRNIKITTPLDLKLAECLLKT
jgi:2-C-methyl-D-erythritol 4-phosphate cytidylyltransferase